LIESRFDAVLFDLAGTLFDDRALRDVHLEQLTFAADAAGVRADDRQLRAAYGQGMAEAFAMMGGRPHYRHHDLFAEAFRGMARALGSQLDECDVQAAVNQQGRATVEFAELRPGATLTLQRLRDLGCHLCVVSNIDQDQLDALLDSLGLRPFVDDAISSEAARSCKPDPRIYQLALDISASTADRCLFVGDTPSHDVAGPAAMGICTAWLDSRRKEQHHAVQPDHIIRTLPEVVGLCLSEVAR